MRLAPSFPPSTRAAVLAVSLLATVAPLGCDEHDHDDDEHTHEQAVEVEFAARVGAEAFGCTTSFTGVGAVTTAELEPLDFRLYVHDVRLIDADGAEWPLALEQDLLWQTSNLALLDFEDKTGTCANGTTEVNTSVRGTVDTGHAEVDFVGLRFKVGVPFELNHQDVATAASPLNLSGLFWNWQGGYKFMRLDMRVKGSGAGGDEGSGINLHLGSTGCTLGEGTTEVASCAAPNRPDIVIADFDVATDKVVVDYAAIVAGVDVTADAGGAPGCMSGKDDPECTPIFTHLGLDVATGLPVAGQTAFRAE